MVSLPPPLVPFLINDFRDIQSEVLKPKAMTSIAQQIKSKLLAAAYPKDAAGCKLQKTQLKLLERLTKCTDSCEWKSRDWGGCSGCWPALVGSSVVFLDWTLLYVATLPFRCCRMIVSPSFTAPQDSSQRKRWRIASRNLSENEKKLPQKPRETHAWPVHR